MKRRPGVVRKSEPVGGNPTQRGVNPFTFDRPDRTIHQPGVSQVWQIVTVAMLGLRAKSVFVPLALRAGIIMIFTAAAVVLKSIATQTEGSSGFDGINKTHIVLPPLLLLGVAALASLPIPAAVPPFIPALAETLTAAVIIGTQGKSGLLFLPYLTIPLFLAGLS